jgi:hypothetical protein
MTARKAAGPAVFLALSLGLLLAAACGGGGEDKSVGGLTDPRTVPTATPWTEAPDPIFLDPEALTPVAAEGGDGEGDGEAEGTPTAGECGDTYIVQSGDAPFSIAEQCGVSVDDLLQLNGIDDPTSLFVGQELQIPQ